MKKSHFGKVSLLGLLIASLTACGGGSDGGTASVSAPSASELMAAYSGITESAPLTENEIYPILSYLTKGDASALVEHSQQIQEDALQELKSINQPKAMASYSENCRYGGKATISGNYNSTSLPIQVTYSYEDCNDGLSIQSGKITYIIRKVDSSDDPTDFSIIYNNYREQYGVEEYFELHGGSEFTEESYCQSTMVSNILFSTQDISILEEDLTTSTNGCNSNEISGRVYFSYLGYVDFTTSEPLQLTNDNQITSGDLTISNEQSTVNIITNDSTSNVTVDSNNDGNLDFELDAPSTHFTEQPFSEVRDDDADGYPNISDLYPDDPNRFEALTLSSTEINITSVLGSDVSQQAFSLSGTNMGWSLSAADTWLKLSETNGIGEQDIEMVIGDLPLGEHQTQVTVTNLLDESTEVITVNIEVIKPTLSVSDIRLTFDLIDNPEQVTQPATLSINTGSQSYDISYEIDISDSEGFSLEMANEVSADSLNLQLTVDPNKLGGGVYNGVINFTVNVLGESITGELALTIYSNSHLLSVPQSGVALTKFPTVELLTREVAILDNYGLTTTQWQANTEASWLDISASGTTSDKLMITADPSGLEADNFYNATITVSPIDSPITNIQTINVGLWIGSSDPAANTSLEVTYTNLTTDPVRPYVYVNNSEADIDVYNVFTQELVSTITEVGISLGDMEVSADGERLFVADTNNDNIHIIDLDNTAYRTRWLSSDSLAAGFALSVTNNQELLISGYGNIYAAQEGLLYVTDAHGSYYGYNYLDASLYGNRFCAVNSGISPYTVSCYNLGFSHIEEQLILSKVDASVPHGTGSNGRDIALNHDGSIAYTASGAPYVFIPIEIDTMTVLETLPADSYPNAVEIGPDNALHGAASSSYGPQDVWIYKDDYSLRHSDYVSGYADNVLARAIAVSGDGFITIAITSAPSLSFVSSY